MFWDLNRLFFDIKNHCNRWPSRDPTKQVCIIENVHQKTHPRSKISVNRCMEWGMPIPILRIMLWYEFWRLLTCLNIKCCLTFGTKFIDGSSHLTCYRNRYLKITNISSKRAATDYLFTEMQKLQSFLHFLFLAYKY